MQNRLIGVCVFDDESNIGSGWASISGEKATRINHFSELPNDVVWITNLNYRVYSRLNLNKLPHVLDEQYFRSSIKNLRQEVGLMNDGEEASVFCARVFQNTFREMARMIGSDSLPIHPYRFYTGISPMVIPKSVRKSPSHQSGFSIQQVVKESTQQNQAMFGVRAPSGSKAIPLTVPRASYFSWLLKQPLPSCSGWREIKDSTVKCTIGTQHGRSLRGTKAAIANLLEIGSNQSLFLGITVKSTDPFYRDFATFGVGANYHRGYATLPEIINMARYSKIEIRGGYRCENLSADEINIDFDSNMFSFSRGLALENLFAALANPLRVGAGEASNGLSAYLRAYDRILCQRHAEIVAKQGLTIGSFGTGKIIVYAQPHEVDHLRNTCLESKLMMPMGLLEDSR